MRKFSKKGLLKRARIFSISKAFFYAKYLKIKKFELISFFMSD